MEIKINVDVLCIIKKISKKCDGYINLEYGGFDSGNRRSIIKSAFEEIYFPIDDDSLYELIESIEDRRNFCVGYDESYVNIYIDNGTALYY